MLAMARLFLSKGAIQFTKKYGAKALKDVKNYITKNKLIWDGKKVIEKTTKIKPKVNPRIKKTTKKTTTTNKKSFDEKLKEVEGTRAFNLRNKKVTNNKTKKVDDTKLTSEVNTLKSSNALSIILGKAQKHPFTTASILTVPTYNAIKKVSDLMKDMGSKTEAKTFGQAFREARKEKGPDAVFTYKGKKYSTVTEDQYKKAGFNSLSEYLNAKKNK
jgi:alanyl-tRNA synthetase